MYVGFLSKSTLFQTIATLMFCIFILIKYLSNKSRAGLGFATASISISKSILLSVGLIISFFLSSISIIFPKDFSSSKISIITLSPTRGFNFLFLKLPLALHSYIFSPQEI